MGLLDRDNNRTIETERLLPEVRASIQPRTYGELPAVSTVNERGLEPVRLPIERQQVGMLSHYATGVTYDRSLADVRSPMQARTMTGRAIDSTEPVTQTSVTESLPLGQSVANYYSTGGSGGGRAYDNPITVVPGGEESGSNSNLGLILIVVALAGGGAYWYYKKGGFNG